MASDWPYPPDPLGEDVDRDLEMAIADAARRLEPRLPTPPPTDLPAALAATARGRGGVFTAQDARNERVAAAALRTLLRRGAIVAVRRGVYAERSTVETAARKPMSAHSLQAAAAVAAFGPGVVASHESAAAIWGIDLLSGCPPLRVRLTRHGPPRRGTRVRSGVVIRYAALPASHVRRRSGILVTSGARTVVDLARELPFRDGVVLADSALHRRVAARSALAEVLVDCSKWPGAVCAGKVVAFADARSESPLESISRVAFYEYGLPAPKPQAWIKVEPQWFRVDFLWRDYRTIGEADGRVKYAEREDVWAEKSRMDDLHDLGFEVVRWTWEVDKHPERVVERVLQTFDRAIRRFNLPVALPKRSTPHP